MQRANYDSNRRARLGPILAIAAIALLATDRSLADEQDDDQPYHTLFAVEYLDANHAWAVGANELIMFSADGGRTWESQHGAQHPMGGTPLFSIAFADPANGIAVGRGTILRTDDGGKLWRPSLRIRVEPEPEPPPEPLVATSEAPAADEPTTEPEADAGPPPDPEPAPEPASETEPPPTDETPEREFLPPMASASVPFTAVKFVDSTTAYLVGGDAIVRTVDRGKSWDIVHREPGTQLFGIDFVDPQTGRAVGAGGIVVVTSDGGETWTSQLLEETWALYDVEFQDQRQGWIVGESGTIMHTTDGGETWKRLDSGITTDVLDVAVTSRGFAFAASTEATLWTSDGQSWHYLSTPLDELEIDPAVAVSPPTIQYLDFASRDLGLAVGQNGLVLATEDGGETWELLRSGHARAMEQHREREDPRNAKARWDTAMGYIQPFGKIADRFKAGFVIEISITALPGKWFEIGGGMRAGLIGVREEIIAPIGEVKEDRPFELNVSGVWISGAIVSRAWLFEHKGWFMTLGLQVGPLYHGVSVDEPHRKEVDPDGYKRSHFGLYVGEELFIGWVKYVYNSRNGKSAGWGFGLKLELDEAWTWSNGNHQVDLDGPDDAEFGTQLWFSATAVMTMMF